jgi:hypothetical protein
MGGRGGGWSMEKRCLRRVDRAGGRGIAYPLSAQGGFSREGRAHRMGVGIRGNSELREEGEKRGGYREAG